MRVFLVLSILVVSFAMVVLVTIHAFFVSATVVTALALGIGFLAGGYIRLRLERRSYESFALTLGPDTIARTVAYVPPLILHRRDVTALERWPGRGLLITSAGRQPPLLVPDSIEAFDEISDNLRSWAPTRMAMPAGRRVLGLFAVYAVLPAWLGSLLAPRWMGLVCAGLLVASVGYLIRVLAMSGNLTRGKKTSCLAWP